MAARHLSLDSEVVEASPEEVGEDTRKQVEVQRTR